MFLGTLFVIIQRLPRIFLLVIVVIDFFFLGVFIVVALFLDTNTPFNYRFRYFFVCFIVKRWSVI